MMLAYMTKGKVKISMYNYINKLLTEFPSDKNESVKTPAASHLFNVNKDATKLVAKLLYLSRITSQDIQMAVSFSVYKGTIPR